MAMGDYHACDNCGAKTFYDANLSSFTGPGGVCLYGTEGIVGHRAYALCGKCEQTHEIRILPKEEAELAEAKAEIEHLADNGCHLEMLLAAMKARGDRLAEAGQQLLEACYQADALEELPEQIDGSLLDAMRLAIWPEIWTDEQADALNAYQDRGDVHPFTCGGDRFDEAHKAAQEEHGGDFGQLVATRQGWVCNACDYRQFWAHDFMFDQALTEWRDQ